MILPPPSPPATKASCARPRRRPGCRFPRFTRFPAHRTPTIAAPLPYPSSSSRSASPAAAVSSAPTPSAFIAAWRARADALADGASPAELDLLVEAYVPGVEVAVEGLLTGGELEVLALFDKPDPLDGPFFEETIYVTPSRSPPKPRPSPPARRGGRGPRSARGPVHAELRINERGVWPIELAGRSIGGLCSSVLEFGAGIPWRNSSSATPSASTIPNDRAPRQAAGVMMIPIPKAGLLNAVDGQETPSPSPASPAWRSPPSSTTRSSRSPRAPATSASSSPAARPRGRRSRPARGPRPLAHRDQANNFPRCRAWIDNRLSPPALRVHHFGDRRTEPGAHVG